MWENGGKGEGEENIKLGQLSQFLLKKLKQMVFVYIFFYIFLGTFTLGVWSIHVGLGAELAFRIWEAKQKKKKKKKKKLGIKF